MRFDPSGLYSAMDEMGKRAQSKGKELGTQQGGFFLRIMKRTSWQIAPSKDELFQVAQKLRWRLKRKPGVSPQKELARRQRARGTFARGWEIVRVQSEKYRIRIWLRDKSNESDLVDTQHGVSDKAEKKTGTDFKTKLDRLADNLTRNF